MGKRYLKWGDIDADFTSYQMKQIAAGLKRYAENGSRIEEASEGRHRLAQLTPEDINRIVRDDFHGDAQAAWDAVLKPVLKDQQRDVAFFDNTGITISDKDYDARVRQVEQERQRVVIDSNVMDCRVALAAADGMDHRYGKDGAMFMKEFIDTHPSIFGPGGNGHGPSYGEYDFNRLYDMIETAADRLEQNSED